MSGSGGGIDFPGYGAKPTLKALAAWGFDAAAQQWREMPFGTESAARDSIRLATFNTWFRSVEPALRHRGLLEVLRESGADVIVLQEVTTALLDAIMAAPWLRERYRFARAPFRADMVPSHGMMLLSRLPFGDAMLHPLPTHMGRNLLTVKARVNDRPLTIATVHLESMRPNADTRGEQLRAIFPILEPNADAVIAGDFNFDSSWAVENRRIDPRYRDVWAALRPQESGYTQDTDRNRMLADAKREAKHVRIDRILLRSDAGVWEPESIELLGTQPVTPQSPRVFPSDHFGLAATLRTHP